MVLSLPKYPADADLGRAFPTLRPGRWWLWLLALAAVVLVIWGIDRVKWTYEVGCTDLAIEFAVGDAATGQPIEGATIDVYVEVAFYRRDAEEKRFSMRTDHGGISRRVCRDNMCTGKRSGLGFTDTFN